MTAAPRLSVVGAGDPLPDPPYPNTVAARGWRFELDVDRCWDSDTWTLAPADLRPWLLMLWAASWKCRPCGSYEKDDSIIAARIGIPFNLFLAHRETLMRGWRLHSDGRLYHPTVTECVLRMEEYRKGEALRKAEWRAKRNQSVATDVPVSVPRDNRGTDGTGTGTGTGLPIEASTSVDMTERRPRKRPPAVPACPVDRLVDGWNQIVAAAGAVEMKVPNQRRAEAIRSRWRQIFDDGAATSTETALKFFHGFFKRCARSAFLTGKSKPTAQYPKPHRATLPGMMEPEKFAKLIEGVYDD